MCDNRKPSSCSFLDQRRQSSRILRSLDYRCHYLFINAIDYAYNKVLMFPGQPHGRFAVSSDGTLKISGVLREDEGYYICSALSVAGSSISKTYLEVTGSSFLYEIMGR